jgi:hypothetical protein
MRPHHLHDRIEPLAVSDLQPAVFVLRQPDEFPGFWHRDSDGLLHQYMLPRQQTRCRDGVMGGSRYGDADDIDERQEFVEGFADAGSVSVRNGMGPFDGMVVHSHEAGPGK